MYISRFLSFIFLIHIERLINKNTTIKHIPIIRQPHNVMGVAVFVATYNLDCERPINQTNIKCSIKTYTHYILHMTQ